MVELVKNSSSNFFPNKNGAFKLLQESSSVADSCPHYRFTVDSLVSVFIARLFFCWLSFPVERRIGLALVNVGQKTEIDFDVKKQTVRLTTKTMSATNDTKVLKSANIDEVPKSAAFGRWAHRCTERREDVLATSENINQKVVNLFHPYPFEKKFFFDEC